MVILLQEDKAWWPNLEWPVNRARQGLGKRILFHCAAMRELTPDRHDVPPRATPLGSARGLANAIAGALRMARALAASGRRVDLAGMEGPIGLLCAKSLDLPPEQGRQMRIVLITLLQEVDVLSETIRAMPDGR